MSSEQPGNQDPAFYNRAAIAERVVEQLGWLTEAAEIISGPGAQVENVFDVPVVAGDIARDDAPMPDWTDDQVDQVRAIAQRFGYGAEQSVASGVDGGLRVAEGGKAWKMIAESVAFDDEKDAHTVIFCGIPFRKLGEDERKFLAEHQGIVVPEQTSEYDLARILAERYADQSVEGEPVPQAFGYAPTAGNPMTTEPTGQLLQIGKSKRGQSVQLLRIEGEPYEEDGQQKERNRPDGARVITLLAEKLTAEANLIDPIVVGTSNTYASRVPDMVRAGLEMDPPRQLGVVMYGRQVLRDMSAPVPKAMPLNHLPGDLRLMHDKLQALNEVLHTH